MENNLFTTALSSVGFLTKIDFEAVDLSLERHRNALYETLCEFGTPQDIARQLMESVEHIIEENNASAKSREERDRLGLKHVAYGFYSKDGQLPVTHKRDGDSFVTASESEYEQAAEDHGEEGARSAPIKDKSSDEPPTPEGDEGEEEQPPVVVKPRPGDSEDAKKAAEAGNVAAELAVDYEKDRQEDSEQEEDEDQ